jgi:hypothetical protein
MVGKALARISAVALALAAALPSPARALAPAIPGQEAFLKRALYVEGRLWLLSDSGQLSSLAEHDAHRAPETLSEPVVDICRRADALVALTCAGDPCKTWTVRQHHAGTWTEEGSVAAAKREELLALSCTDDTLVLLTDQRLVERSKANTRTVALSDDPGIVLVASAYIDGASLWVGIDAGEWGGGLRRIDRRTGKVASVERNATGGLCDGPLNRGCDPVNAVVGDPWHPGCVVAAIGLVHFMSHGRLVEVCGDKVSRLYYKRHGEQPPPNPDYPETSDEPPISVAFYGLVRAGNTLWAAGLDGLYRFDGGAAPKLVPLPRFKTIDGIAVSFDLPGMALVLTAINGRRAMSGGVPMLVAR